MKSSFKKMHIVSALVALLLCILNSGISHATWGVLDSEVERKSFVITPDEVVTSPSNDSLYAVIEYGVITKIFYWSPGSRYLWPTEVRVGPLSLESLKDLVIVASVPNNIVVPYNGADGITRSEAINHSDRVEIAPSVAPVSSTSPEIIPSTPIIATSINSDSSTSITVLPSVLPEPGKTVEVQVIANGLSYTSIGIGDSNAPVTINNLPQDSLITVQSVIRTVATSEERVVQDVLVHTPAAQLPALQNARDVAADISTISAPQVVSSSAQAGGSKSAIVSFAPITNFNSDTTRAGIVVVGPQGESTYIGIDGTGGNVTVNDLSPTLNYTLKLVLRDLNTGEETIIAGNPIQGA